MCVNGPSRRDELPLHPVSLNGQFLLLDPLLSIVAHLLSIPRLDTLLFLLLSLQQITWAEDAPTKDCSTEYYSTFSF